MERFLEDIGVGEEVNQFVDAIWSSVSDEIDDRWLETLETPAAASRVMDRLDGIVAWAMNTHDGTVEEDVPQEKYIPDDEPIPARVDPWARGIVSVRKPPSKSSADLLKNVDMDSPNRTPSVSSYRSSTTGRSGTHRTGSKAGSVRGYEGTHLNFAADDEGPEIFNIDEDEDDFSMLNKTGEMFNKIMRQRKKDDEVEVDEPVDEFELLREQVEKIAQGAKGKKFTFDASGEPIYINPVRAEKLPPFAVAPGLNISSRPDASAAPPSSSEGARGGKKNKKIKVAGAPDLYFTATNDLASSLVEAEPAAAAGVTLKMGDRVREGPSVPSDPKKISRREFFSRGASLVGAESSMMDGTMRGEVTSPTSDFDESLDMDDSLLPASMIQSRYREVDPFEGGRKRSPEHSGGGGGGGDDGESAGKNVQDQEVRLPGKPSAQQQYNIALMSGGADNQGLRDRVPLIAQKEPGSMKKMPAPPVGHVSIYNTAADDGPGSPMARGGDLEASQSMLRGSTGGGGSLSSRGSPTKGKRQQGVVKQERKDLTRALF